MEEIKNKLKENKLIILFIVCIIVFVIWVVLIKFGMTTEFDKTVANFIQTTIPDEAHVFLECITNLGGVLGLTIIALITVIMLFIKHKKEYAILTAVNIITSTVLYEIIKNIIKRPRPENFRFIVETGYSCPSGHSANNFAFYGLMICLVLREIKNKKIRIALSILMVIYILIMGISRIYFNVHYPSDVIAGYILGLTVVTCSNIFLKNYEKDLKK